MPAKNPRVNVVLEKPLYKRLGDLAKRDGLSLSMTIRDLVKEAMEMREDAGLASIAKSREKTFKRKSALKHSELF